MEEEREIRYYYADVDNFGVLCVDQVGDDGDCESATRALAKMFPNTIYFEVEKPEPKQQRYAVVNAFGRIFYGSRNEPAIFDSWSTAEAVADYCSGEYGPLTIKIHEEP